MCGSRMDGPLNETGISVCLLWVLFDNYYSYRYKKVLLMSCHTCLKCLSQVCVCNHSQRLDSILSSHAWTLHGQWHFLSNEGEMEFSSPDTPVLHPKLLPVNFSVNLIPEYKRDMNIWSKSSKGSKTIKGREYQKHKERLRAGIIQPGKEKAQEGFYQCV